MVAEKACERSVIEWVVRYLDRMADLNVLDPVLGRHSR
jgi:hypothetical protein